MPFFIEFVFLSLIIYNFYPFVYPIGKVSDEIGSDTQTFSLDYTVDLEKTLKKICSSKLGRCSTF